MNSKEIFESDPLSWWFPYIVAIFVGIITCVREYAGGPECPSKNLITNKIVLITGGSGRIGYEVALELAKRGGIIILACKDIEKGEQSREKIIKIIPQAVIIVKKLDIASIVSIRNFVNDLSYRKIDILINNAGIQNCTFQITDDGFENHFVTNYLGHFYLTHLLLPKLQSAGKARIINITDNVHKNVKIDLNNLNMVANWNPVTAYAQSKLCLVLMAKYMSKLLAGYRITINAISPGLVRGTGLRNSPFNTLLKLWSYPCLWLFYKSPTQGAQSIIYAAVDTNFDKITGKFISDCGIQNHCKQAQGDKLSEELYRTSCTMLGISPIVVKPL